MHFPMINQFKRLAIAGAITLPMIGVGLTGTPAHAENATLSDVAHIVGHAPLDTPLPLTGGSSTFSSVTTTTCNGVSDTAETGACTLSASGSINNSGAGGSCGTGTVTLSFVLTEANGDTISANNMAIAFVAGQGRIVQQTVTEDDTKSGEPDGAIYTATLTGTVDAVPDADTNPGECTRGFTFTFQGTVTE
jgi:hypothetical protein